MAGICKPQIDNLGSEGEIFLISSMLNSHLGKNFVKNNIDGLFDNKVTDYRYGEVLFRDSFIEFKCINKIKIWALSTKHYFDSAGSTPQNMIIQKWNGSEYINIDERPTRDDGVWYELTDILKEGQYRIKEKKRYINIDELYIENIKENNFLINDGNSNYSIKPEFYLKDSYNGLGDIICIKNEETNKYMENSIKNYLSKTTINQEEFRPIDKFDKFRFLIKVKE